MFIPTTQLRSTSFPLFTYVGISGAQKVTVSTAVVASGSGLTFPSGATYCYLSVEGDGAIRFYNTGDVPTASNGHYLDIGFGPLELTIAGLQMILDADATGDATVQISYHKYV